MKKRVLPLMMPLLVAMAITLTGCGNQESKDYDNEETEAEEEVEEESEKSNKLKVEIFSERFHCGTSEMCYQEVLMTAKIDFPTADTDLANSIRAYINDELGGKYTGDLQDCHAMLDFYSKQLNSGMEDDMLCSIDYIFLKTFESENLVTYLFTTTIYTGGAHGFSNTNPVSFDKRTGHKISITVKDLFNDIDGLTNAIETSLCQYFEVSNKKDLYDNLMLADGATRVPLPTTDPLLEGDSITFQYQEYEIAPYCYGFPTAKIAISDVEPFMSSYGKELLK